MSDEQTRERAEQARRAIAADVRRRRRGDRLASISRSPEIPGEAHEAPPTADHPTGAGIEPQPQDPGRPQPPQLPVPLVAQHLDGVVTIDAAELNRLQELAAAPDRIAADLARREREQLVLAAIRDGRLLPRDRDRWLGALARDRNNATELLASLPVRHNLISPEIGHARVEPAPDNSWFR